MKGKIHTLADVVGASLARKGGLIDIPGLDGVDGVLPNDSAPQTSSLGLSPPYPGPGEVFHEIRAGCGRIQPKSLKGWGVC